MSQRGWLSAPNTLICWDEGPKREWTTDRKLRLWACAVCRRIWHLLPDERSRRAVEVLEQLADGLATEKERAAAFTAAKAATASFNRDKGGMEEVHNWAASAAEWAVDEDLTVDAENLSFLAAAAVRRHAAVTGPPEERAMVTDNREGGPFAVAAEEAADLAQANLLREVFGNPFRPVKVKPAWLTDTVLALAKQMYESREFSAMPILADALQDAGCDNDDVLAHCRDTGATHVRGCWVVDLLLGLS